MSTKLTGYYAVAETKQGCGKYYYAIFGDSYTYTVGDKILVSGMCREILTITKILTPDEANEVHSNISEEVICKVNTDDYDRRIVNRKKKAELKKAMNKRLKELMDIDQFKWAAERDATLAKMLEEYEQMGE